MLVQMLAAAKVKEHIEDEGNPELKPEFFIQGGKGFWFFQVWFYILRDYG